MSAATPALPLRTRRRWRLNLDSWTQRTALIVLILAMGLFILAPLMVLIVQAITNDSSSFVGIQNFMVFFASSGLRNSLQNTLVLGTATMLVTVLLAFPFAYAIACTRMPLRKLLAVLCMLPLYAPTMLYGIGLYGLFGNQGILTTGFFGRIHLHLLLDIHGLTGIIIAEALATFPPAVLILVVSLSHRDRRFYDAAESMGVSPFRTFWCVTFPMCRAGLVSAAMIAFVLSTTDYGAPEMLAEKTNVLALDIAIKALGIGQKSDHAMGAVISLVLIIPTVIATAVQFSMRRKMYAALTAKSVVMTPQVSPARDWLFFTYCVFVTAIILLITLCPMVISFSSSWPYSLYPRGGFSHFTGPGFTLANFDFDKIGRATGGGMDAYFNSLVVAALTAIAGTAVTFTAAYLVAKSQVLPIIRQGAKVIAAIPLGLPGMVLGLAFVLIFNPLKWGPFPNPTAGLYGTFALLVIVNVVHYLGVSFLTATAAVSQLDAEFEQVAASMAVPLWRVFMRVAVPICTPAILEIAVYYFVSAMTTVSAVMFLVSVRTPLASVAIINLKDAGDLEPAAAMAMMILLSNLVVRAAAEPVIRTLRPRAERWRA
jgi:iron(III) transport system permease protein